MRHIHLSRLLFVIGIALAGSVHAQELIVSAAASLTNAFQTLGASYERSHPGQKITFNFAASGPLLAQLQQGAPVDVFASADEATMERAAAAKLLAEDTRAVFAHNTLVVVVPGNLKTKPADLQALTGPAYPRIATGTPASVPAGRYTEEAIAKAGLTQALKPRWIFGESVRQVLDYVARGEVDAGFVYRTDAMLAPHKTPIAFTVPTASAVRYPIAQIAASRHPQAARKFIAYVRGPEGQAVLQRFGFTAP